MKDNLIANKAYTSATNTIKLSKILTEDNGYVLSKQILKSGTSIGANVEEARETYYWLKLPKDSNYISNETFLDLEQELLSSIKILYKIVEPSKE